MAVDPLTRRTALGAAGHSARAARFSATNSICSCCRPAATKRRFIGRSTANCWAPARCPGPSPATNVYYDGMMPAGAVRPCPTRESISRAVSSSPGRARRRDKGSSPVLALFDPWQQKAVWPSRTFARGACVSVVGRRGGGRPGTERTFRPARLGRRPHDRRSAIGGPPHFSLTDLRCHADGRPIHRAGPRQPNLGNGAREAMQMP